MKKATASSILVTAMMLAVAVLAQAQQPVGIPRMGVLPGASASFYSAWLEALRQRLRDFGYIEGKTFSLTTDTQTGKLTGCLTSRPSSSVSKSTSSSPPARAF